MRVIQALHHSLSPFKPDSDARFYEESWHVKVAKHLAVRHPDIDVECWRPEHTLDSVFERTDSDGIKHRIFPSTHINFKLELSTVLLRAMRRASTDEDVIIHLHGLYNYHTYAMLTAIDGRCPVVGQSHGGVPARWRVTHDDSLFKRLYFLTETVPQRYALPRVDQLLALTTTERNALTAYAPTDVSPMGVDFDEYVQIEQTSARDTLELSNTGKMTVHYLGRLAPEKGVDLLLRAVAALRAEGVDIVANIAGSGESEESLRNLADDLGVADAIEFLGFIDAEDKPAFYNAADVVCFPSREEPYGIVPIEALACETPLVATNVGGVSDIADSFEGGTILVEPEDKDALTAGLQGAVRGDISPADINRSAGRERHGWDSIIENTFTHYNALLGIDEASQPDGLSGQTI